MGGSEHKSGTGDAARAVKLGLVVDTQVQRRRAERSNEENAAQFGGAYAVAVQLQRSCRDCLILTWPSVRGRIAGFREVLRFGGVLWVWDKGFVRCPLSVVSGQWSVVSGGQCDGGEV